MAIGIATNLFRLRCRERRLFYCYYCYVYIFLLYVYISHLASWCSSAILTEVFPCFFLSCKANVRLKPAKMGHGPHFFKFLYCSTYCLFCVVLCFVCVQMCTVLLPPGGYPIAVNKYTCNIISTPKETLMVTQ